MTRLQFCRMSVDETIEELAELCFCEPKVLGEYERGWLPKDTELAERINYRLNGRFVENLRPADWVEEIPYHGTLAWLELVKSLRLGK